MQKKNTDRVIIELLQTINSKLEQLLVMLQPVKSTRKWSKEDVKILRTMVEEGYTYRIIARKLGRSVWAVQHKAQAENLARTYNIPVNKNDTEHLITV